MGDWGEILNELNRSAAARKGPPDFDAIRRRYLALIAEHTGRSTILYAAKFTQPHTGVDISSFTTIADQDLQGIMTVLHGLPGPNLDLILHSPGGSPQAAEALVLYLRSKFNHIRVIVPHLAMSAATMIACAADTIVMGKHSFLGPIDPQLIVRRDGGAEMIPAQAILDQFELAKKECSDPKKAAAWVPMLQQYGPGLLVTCKHASSLAEQLVRDWLRIYMFKRRRNKAEAVRKIARWLGMHKRWKSHGRHIPRDVLQRHGLSVEHLEEDQIAQDLFLSVFHATTHTFTCTGAVKIIENNLGKAHVQALATFPAAKVATPPSKTDPSDLPSDAGPTSAPAPPTKRAVRRKPVQKRTAASKSAGPAAKKRAKSKTSTKGRTPPIRRPRSSKN